MGGISPGGGGGTSGLDATVGEDSSWEESLSEDGREGTEGWEGGQTVGVRLALLASPARGKPQLLQKPLSSGLARPHCGHFIALSLPPDEVESRPPGVASGSGSTWLVLAD